MNEKMKKSRKGLVIMTSGAGFTKFTCPFCGWEYAIRFYTQIDFNAQISCVNPECRELIFRRNIEKQLWEKEDGDE